METISNLENFSNILKDKGYDGYFHTQGSYPDRLKKSIEAYLKSCEHGNDTPPKESMLLTTYVQWKGEDEPHIVCDMYVKHLNGKFFLNKMEINRNAPFSGSVKKIELLNLTVFTVPSRLEAIAMVSDTPKQEQTTGLKRGRF